MSDAIPDMTRLIAGLSADLRPVRRVYSPAVRTVLWCGLIGAGMLALSPLTDWHGLMMRLISTPDMAMAELGAVLTSILAAFAAFALSVPGRSGRWAFLPLPGLILWLSFSGIGCLRQTVAAHTIAEPAGHMMLCLRFLLMVSLPLGAVMLFLLRRAYVLRPGITTAMGGLACAGAAAVWLSLIHPFDASAPDLLSHLAAVLLIILWVRLAGQRALARGRRLR